MTREDIEKKSMDYFGFTGKSNDMDSQVRELLYKAFVEGAQWRINSVWHDASEKPDKNQLVVFECKKTYGKGYSVNFGENYGLLKNVLLSWAYMKDLIPERKEETK